MRSVPALAAMALGAVALASGCGQQHQGAPAGPPPSASAPVPADPGAASCPAASAARAITLTYADNGRKFCVRRGTAVLVYLKGSPANRWAAIRASGGVLAPHATGHLTLALGVTGASFLAAHPGTAVITSTRQVCGPGQTPPNAGNQSGIMECGVILAFRATVKVT